MMLVFLYNENSISIFNVIMGFSKIVLVVIFGLALCFAQETPEKIAIYVSGASDIGVEDLTSVSNELAGQLLTPSVAAPPPAAVVADTVPPSSDVAPAPEAVQKQCERLYNMDEPYEPPAMPVESGESDSSKEKDESRVSFGIRAGFNLSHTYSEYNLPYYGSGSGDFGNIFGMQLGFVVDFAPSSRFHIQPGLMYVQKGMEDKRGETTAHYIELPLLLSLKLSAFRLNAGPYLGLCVSSSNAIFGHDFDFGLSTGIGFDIGMFYIGSFYDYGLTDMSNMPGYSFYNRTLGFNVGINL